MMSRRIIALQVADASSLNSGHAHGRLHTPKPFPRFVEHIIALLLLRKMMKRRRMWKDRLLFVPFDYNLYSVSAGACRSALGLEVLQDRSRLPWEWMFTPGGV